MRRMRSVLIALGLAGIVSMGASVAGPAGQGYQITYYDAAGNVVGGQLANCGGQVSSWGVRTIFRKITYFYCEP